MCIRFDGIRHRLLTVVVDATFGKVERANEKKCPSPKSHDKCRMNRRHHSSNTDNDDEHIIAAKIIMFNLCAISRQLGTVALEFQRCVDQKLYASLFRSFSHFLYRKCSPKIMRKFFALPFILCASCFGWNERRLLKCAMVLIRFERKIKQINYENRFIYSRKVCIVWLTSCAHRDIAADR